MPPGSSWQAAAAHNSANRLHFSMWGKVKKFGNEEITTVLIRVKLLYQGVSFFEIDEY